MSVGNVSPGKRDSLPIPARDSQIERHTSSLLRPIEQRIPAPVTAIRTEVSGLRMMGLRGGEIKRSTHHLDSVDGAASDEAERAAERRFQGDHEADEVARR